MFPDGKCAEGLSRRSDGGEHKEGVVRGVHQHNECHLRQIQKSERRVGLNFHFMEITKFERDYEFKDLERDKSKTEEKEGPNLFRWDGLIQK